MEETKKEKKPNSLEKLKQEYEKLREKYGLPGFTYMNENFEIESVAGEETELLIKRIRKQVTEKIYYYLRTLETFMNPQNSPMFIFDIIKSFGNYEQELIKNLYKKLAGFEINFFGLEIVYSEKKEADFVKKIAEEWPEINKNLEKIHEAMKNNYNKDNSKKTSKSYVG